MSTFLSRRRSVTMMGGVAVLVLGYLLARPSIAHAQGIDQETQFVLNTFAFLVWGALVMWMCAGFTMLESGAVRTKNASMICLKNIGIYSIAGLAYFFIGYNLMYVDVGDVIGAFKFMYGPTADELALVGGQAEAAARVIEGGYSTMSDWFFQMVFVATAASIVSGAIAERVKIWSFFLVTLILTGLIYPVVGAWTWGGGWLDQLGFQDFAGSTIVHSTGGWAALAGVIMVGPRLGKFRRDGSVSTTPPSNVLVSNPGRLYPVAWVVRLQRRVPACVGQRPGRSGHEPRAGQHQPGRGRRCHGGPGSFPPYSWPHGAIRRPERGHRWAGVHHRRPRHRRPLLGHHHRSGRRRALHGGSQADGDGQAGRRGRRDPGTPGCRNLGHACGEHSRGSTASTCSYWGLLRVGAFVFTTSLVVWVALSKTLGLRVSPQVERLGQDAGELGIEAYPEFVLMPEDYEEEEEE